MRYIRLLVLLTIVLFLFHYSKIVDAENFTNDDFGETYVKIYNKVFADTLIPRYDIDHIIATLKINPKTASILDAGTGTGKHYKILSEKVKNVVGVDKSQTMLKYANINVPLGTFKHGDLVDPSLFEPKSFSHILLLQDTFYHNNSANMEKIIINMKKWLMPKGYICIHIMDNTNLDPSPRTFSILSKDKQGRSVSTTNFDGFTHTAKWLSNSKYCETVSFGKKTYTKCHEMNVPDKQVLIKMFLDKGFNVANIIDLVSLRLNTCNIYVFQLL